MSKHFVAPAAIVLLVALLVAVACGSGGREADVRIQRADPPPSAGAVEQPRAGAPSAAAATPQPAKVTVFLDAGHGGSDPGWGSAAVLPVGQQEKDLTLDLAKRTAAHLERHGFRVVLSRTTDTDVNKPARDINGDGVEDIVDELQARVDLANESGAAVLLSLHFNALQGTSLGGSGTWYNAKREFSDKNLRFATLVQKAQLAALADLGYTARDWGVMRDDAIDAPSQSKIDSGYKHNTLIGPVGPGRNRPSKMPGAIVQPLFLTHPKESELARDPQVRDGLAKAYARAIREFLGSERDDRGGAVLSGDTQGPALLVERVRTSQKVVALTFDAGAGVGHTTAILDILSRKGIHATFSLTGAWCDANPELARRIAADGHAVISHSYSHASWTGRSPGTRPLSTAQRHDELQRAEQALELATGQTGRPFFRTPYGDYDASVHHDLGEAGYRYNVLWTFDSNAWRGAKADDIARKGIKAAAPGVIYVFHVAELQDALALTPLVEGIAAAGYAFVTLPQLFSAQ